MDNNQHKSCKNIKSSIIEKYQQNASFPGYYCRYDIEQMMEAYSDNAQKNIRLLTDELLQKTSALEEIQTACKPIKDNPNVAWILQRAEEGLKNSKL